MRGHGDCLMADFDMWIGGFPRSANTFTSACFKLANPKVKVASHYHIPAFIINWIQKRKPGLFLIRQPVDSVVSWTIFWQGQMKVGEALDYYIDFHRAMLGYREDLFLARFEEAVSDFAGVVKRLNARFGTRFSALPEQPGSLSRCISYIEDHARGEDGRVNEFTVSRPSNQRVGLKPKLLEELKGSDRLVRKMEVADQLYRQFCEGRPHFSHNSHNRLDAMDITAAPV